MSKLSKIYSLKICFYIRFIVPPVIKLSLMQSHVRDVNVSV